MKWFNDNWILVAFFASIVLIGWMYVQHVILSPVDPYKPNLDKIDNSIQITDSLKTRYDSLKNDTTRITNLDSALRELQ